MPDYHFEFEESGTWSDQHGNWEEGNGLVRASNEAAAERNAKAAIRREYPRNWKMFVATTEGDVTEIKADLEFKFLEELRRNGIVIYDSGT